MDMNDAPAIGETFSAFADKRRGLFINFEEVEWSRSAPFKDFSFYGEFVLNSRLLRRVDSRTCGNSFM